MRTAMNDQTAGSRAYAASETDIPNPRRLIGMGTCTVVSEIGQHRGRNMSEQSFGGSEMVIAAAAGKLANYSHLETENALPYS